jgi:ATP-binding cassette subfamily G (WHITE) protein 2
MAPPQPANTSSSNGNNDQFSIAHPASLELPSASLTFKNLSFCVQDAKGERKPILEPCSGHLKPGQLVALMGPSGCGKSTLLDMLAMKKTAKYDGEVLVNGHVRDPRTFQRVAVYVGQEDVMPQHWKVREAIKFNAALKSPMKGQKGWTSAAVDLLLEAFGLSGVKDTCIGGPLVRGISGGQRRRVTLARGIAAQGSLVFCDEPTSGLSATDAELCIKALNVIAKRLRVLVMVVIHQPRVEVAKLFDTLLLLTSGPGRIVYQGAMEGAIAYMEAVGRPVPQYVNPTDYFLDLVTPGIATDASALFVEAYRQKLEPQILRRVEHACVQKGLTVQEMLCARPGTRLGKYAVPFHTQFFTLLRRKLAITMRNPLAIALPLIIPTFLGAAVGIFFRGVGDGELLEQISFVFVLVTLLGLGGLGLMPLLIDQRHYMKMETSETLYSVGASVLSSFLVDVPLTFMGAAYEVLICFYISGFDSSHLVTMFSWSMLLFFFYDALFGLCAACAQDGQQAMSIAVAPLAVCLLCNGFFIPMPTAPAIVKLICPISPNFYALQAIVYELIQSSDSPLKGWFLTYTGFTEGAGAQGVIVVVAEIIVLRGLQLLALKYMHNVQK